MWRGCSEERVSPAVVCAVAVRVVALSLALLATACATSPSASLSGDWVEARDLRQVRWSLGDGGQASRTTFYDGAVAREEACTWDLAADNLEIDCGVDALRAQITVRDDQLSLGVLKRRNVVLPDERLGLPLAQWQGAVVQRAMAIEERSDDDEPYAPQAFEYERFRQVVTLYPSLQLTRVTNEDGGGCVGFTSYTEYSCTREGASLRCHADEIGELHLPADLEDPSFDDALDVFHEHWQRAR
jgi:hypothetical protein